MNDDPIVDEVRKTRERLAEEFNFDPGAIFEDLRRRQATLGTRLVRRQRKTTAKQAATPDRDSAARHAGR